MKDTILIIDPIISATYLATRLAEEGFSVIALQTLHNLPSYFSFKNVPFDAIVTSSGKIEEDMYNLSQYKDLHIISGFTGLTLSVPYAEKLLQTVFSNSETVANDPATSYMRTNKFSMNHALSIAGAPSLQQALIEEHLPLDDKVTKATDFFNLIQKDCVLKPDSGSAGSYGVSTIQSGHDIKKYFEKRSNRAALLCNRTNFVIQEKLLGMEYWVDLAAFSGEVLISGIGAYHKEQQDNQFEYQWIDTFDLYDTELIGIKKFIREVATVLGIKNGLYHIELMKTESGYRLIEVNSRISGIHGLLNVMAKSMNGFDQIDAYLSLLKNKNINNNSTKLYNRCYFLKNKKGNFSAFNKNEIESLPTVSTLHVLKTQESNFDASSQTVLDTVALIRLEAKSQQEIDTDTERLQFIETHGICLLDK